MKKFLGVFSVLVMVFVLSGCGGKAETDTFTQSPMAGTDVSITIEHKGDKVTKVSCKAVFDNEKLFITDEDMAKQVADAFEKSSNLKDSKMKYTDKETVITYEAPENSVKTGTSFKEGEKQLTDMGFKKK
ncbi:hypothetical protein UAY_00301 [Enterococcus moraviensis ATCC BAA-383]|uniref:Lipoprotein n=1 Tax=Enterococcus moraviensis ATCC BAA-383 TaxID=1158609 RepID=R2TP54_9ENTE|nr:DUF1307 domain-containing protein [Enterococcus moraviensis]EOI06959.1 hypothetical protein UAY_00301 [Enterococcus moraviensis ATCC BAA-383]EOT65301.1 hypothetical protein I586_03035 [Enterococcus moraviensis ATCC BAA-383]OJG66811.1 hypothetical protein RV09_GL003280 [Enterococcus moraviensis]